MSLKFIKPTTPGQRKRVLVDYSNLSKTKPPKNLVKVFLDQRVEITMDALLFIQKEGVTKENNAQSILSVTHLKQQLFKALSMILLGPHLLL